MSSFKATGSYTFAIGPVGRVRRDSPCRGLERRPICAQPHRQFTVGLSTLDSRRYVRGLTP